MSELKRRQRKSGSQSGSKVTLPMGRGGTPGSHAVAGQETTEDDQDFHRRKGGADDLAVRFRRIQFRGMVIRPAWTNWLGSNRCGSRQLAACRCTSQGAMMTAAPRGMRKSPI